eukprot:TRINITY_DN3626_c1_g1_i3.p1 TRINITY_DN3626_c1_g1~~TRINITY_DN3626_c1_g1_i3.p1  ORF type:complete len:471 (-),score=49.54 TRINITY_DN3626_c1_g1_i3:167-1426(-)
MELSILCGSEVVLLVWGPAGTGKVTAYGSTDIHQLLSRYSQPDDPPSSSFTNSDYEGLFERKGKKGGPPAKKAKTSPTTPATPPTSRKSTPRATTRGRPYSPEQPKAAFVTTTTTTESPDCTVPPVSTPIESHPPTHNHPPPLQVLYPSPQEPTITTNTASSTNKASPDLFDTSLQIPFATYQTTLPFPSPGNYALPSSRITPVLEDTNRSEKMQTSRALTVKVSPARASSPTLPEAIITGSKSTTTTTTQSKVKPRWGNKRLTVHIPNLNSGSPSIGSPATLFSGPILSPFRPLPIITGSNEVRVDRVCTFTPACTTHNKHINTHPTHPTHTAFAGCYQLRHQAPRKRQLREQREFPARAAHVFVLCVVPDIEPVFPSAHTHAVDAHSRRIRGVGPGHACYWLPFLSPKYHATIPQFQ